MNMWSLLVCGALFLFASVASEAGSYQRTRDGETYVWRDSPARGDEATWSGKRDKNGFATGSGVLTWYKVKPTIVTGSNISNRRRSVSMIDHYSGTMVRGKFKGAVTYIEADGRRSQGPVKASNRQSRRKNATRTASSQLKAIDKAGQTPTESSAPIIVDAPERTSPPGTPMLAPNQSPLPIAAESQSSAPVETASSAADKIAAPPEGSPDETASPFAEDSQPAAPSETGALPAKRIMTPPSEQDRMQPDTQSTTVSKPGSSNGSSHSLSVPPQELPKPPRTIDAETVSRLNALYQAAVKANDVAIMDEILADDFVLVTSRGDSLTKADLIKEAKEKRTIYEQQEVEKGTQKVRIWRDTAIVTALLKTKGMRDQNPFEYKIWLTETYVRTPIGWRYVFGQASKPETEAGQ